MTITIDKLFYELLQVSVGQLDCLTRGPSPEEWHELYDIAHRQQVVGLCYVGLQRLFEFGLRAPQDLSIDWMADAEETDNREQALASMLPFTIFHPLRNFLFKRWQKKLGGSLYNYNGRQKVPTFPAAVVLLLMQSYELFNSGKLTMGQLMELFDVMNKPDYKLTQFRDGTTVQQVLHQLGIWNFSCAVMWVLGETVRLKEDIMPCSPLPTLGQMVLQDVMSVGTKVPIVERIKRWLLRFVRF
jgi:hypothetical protein